MPALDRTGTTRPLGNASAAVNLLAGEPASWPRPMRAPIEFSNTAGVTSLPVGWVQSAQELDSGMRAIQIARLDGPQAAEVVEIDEPTANDGEVLIDVH